MEGASWSSGLTRQLVHYFEAMQEVVGSNTAAVCSYFFCQFTSLKKYNSNAEYIQDLPWLVARKKNIYLGALNLSRKKNVANVLSTTV